MAKNSKNGRAIDVPAYEAWQAKRSASTNAASPVESTSGNGRERRQPPSTLIMPQDKVVEDTINLAAPYPTSFSEIVELITTGQSVPGIKDVPDILLEGQASQPTACKRRKPWEKEEVERMHFKEPASF